MKSVETENVMKKVSGKLSSEWMQKESSQFHPSKSSVDSRFWMKKKIELTQEIIDFCWKCGFSFLLSPKNYGNWDFSFFAYHWLQFFTLLCLLGEFKSNEIGNKIERVQFKWWESQKHFKLVNGQQWHNWISGNVREKAPRRSNQM